MKITGKILSAILALSMLFTLAACGKTADKPAAVSENQAAAEIETEKTEAMPEAETEAEPAAEAQPDTITITDHAGNEVTVPSQIERVAIIGIWPLASVITVFFNSGEKIVGMPAASMTAAQNGLLGQLYPEVLNADTEYMTGEAINLEELTALDPDVVFYNMANSAYGEQLAAAGFTAVALGVNTWGYNCIETLNHWIELLSQMFPQNDKAQKVADYSAEVYDLVQSRVASLSDEERARVFFLFQYTDSNILTSGSSFFGQWWCDAIGAVNVAEEINTDNSVSVNLEQVYQWNPNVILISNYTSAKPDDLINNTVGSYDWSEVEAVKTGRLYKMPLGFYRSYTPGVDTPITLLWMAKSVYPELFEDIDITETAHSYYSEIFGVELTDEQISSIFTPTTAASVIE